MTTFASDVPFDPDTGTAADRDAESAAGARPSAEQVAGVPAELPLEITSQREDSGAVIMQVRGSVEQVSAGEFKRAVLGEIRAGAGVIVLDLSGLTFLCLSGVEVLATLRQVADLNGAHIMWVTGGNPAVRRALRAARLAATETLAADLQQARASAPAVPLQRGGRA